MGLILAHTRGNHVVLTTQAGFFKITVTNVCKLVKHRPMQVSLIATLRNPVVFTVHRRAYHTEGMKKGDSF